MRLFATALLVATASLAHAETYDSAGTVTGQAASTITALSDGHMIMFTPSTHNAFDMAVDGHPFADMSGDCNGTMEINGPSARGSGHCIYENAAGENMVVNWIARQLGADGGFHGDWIVVGGTGRMAGASGGGSFVSVTDQSTGSQTVTLSGALSL